MPHKDKTMSSAAASDLAADSAAEAAPARFPDNDTVGAALLSYLLLKLIHSPLPIATSLLGNVSFSRLDPHLPQIATPPADAQLIVTAVISAIDYLKKDQHAAALRCFQIAANSYIEMLEAGHISEAGGAFHLQSRHPARHGAVSVGGDCGAACLAASGILRGAIGKQSRGFGRNEVPRV